MPRYTYQTLEKQNSEFRLLRISKDPITHQPQCSLQKYSLINCPDYTALSYTWGEPTPTRTVAVDGASLKVRQNLFDFLRAYTTEPWGMDHAGRPEFYWIDQICINQEDPDERSDQVRIMDKIYKQTKMVFIWLGCDPNMVEAARLLRDHKSDGRWATVTLLAHPYFIRIWIVQEILLSSKLPLIVCGGIELSLDRVSFAALHLQPSLRPAAFGLMRKVSTVRDGERRTLQECIHSHCEGNSHDPRDKVYGLLGLTPERWRVWVDCTKEVLEVYFDAVAALYEELFDLTDPACLYPADLTCLVRPRDYRDTLVTLVEAMGFSHRQVNGVFRFLEYIEGAYLNTKIRNVQYTYSGRIYTRVRAQPSSEHILAPTEGKEGKEEEEDIEVSWGSITATRRNPLLRDIIPEMGLELADTSPESRTGVYWVHYDKWWCKHAGEKHYFSC